MGIQILKSGDYRVMPWKNGKGTTTEIAIFPEGSTLEENNFLWRISSAGIIEDGPFSAFNGCQRYLAVIDGPGVVLDIDGREETLSLDSVACFSGDSHVQARLLGSPVKDLNLILKKDLVQGRLEVFSRSVESLTLSSGTHFLFVISGSVSLSLENQSALSINQWETAEINLGQEEKTKLSITVRDGSRYALIQCR